MKITTVVVAFLLMAPAGALAQGARLQIDHLDRLAAKASEAVNVTVDSAMLKIAAAFLKGDDKQQAAAKEMLMGLRGIYVRSFEFDSDNAYTDDDINTIRRQLASPQWLRIVSVENKRDRELVEVHVFQEGDRNGGLAIIAAERNELTVVNIVGPIDLASLSALTGQFGIPNIPQISTTPGGR